LLGPQKNHFFLKIRIARGNNDKTKGFLINLWHILVDFVLRKIKKKNLQVKMAVEFKMAA
jgi:hypothetical protein